MPRKPYRKLCKTYTNLENILFGYIIYVCMYMTPYKLYKTYMRSLKSCMILVYETYIESGHQHKVGLKRYKGLKRTRQTKENQ